MSDASDDAGADQLTEAPAEPDPVEDLALQAPEDEHTRAEWEAATAAVLRKSRRLADGAEDSEVWDALAIRTLDDVAVAPLGVPAIVEDLATRGRPQRTGPWDVRASVHGPADRAVLEALADLEGGATSLLLTVDDALPPEQLAEALDGVHLDLAPAILRIRYDDQLAAARALVQAIGDRVPAPGTNLGVDPLTPVLDLGERGDGGDEPAAIAVEAAAVAREAGTLALVVDGTAAHDLGASDAQELGWAMAVGVAYLRALEKAGVGVDDAAALIEFRFAATDEQFPTIGKLRAARRLWARVTEASGGAPAVQRQHAMTSRPMMSRYDPYVNMIRTTVAAFAAGVGGADAVTVLPFDQPLGRPTGLGRRVARNTSHLLVQESHVANVTDPAGGAWAVERLTDDLAKAGWAELGRIEAAGGASAAVPEVRERIAATAERRDREVATGRRPLTGTTDFPNLAETLPTRDGEPDDVRRWGADFEAMRDHPAERPVFLATMGSVAAHTARATFATNLLAAGGIGVLAAGPTEGVPDVLAAYHEAGDPPVVCLAGTDPAYAEWGAALAAALREAGARRLVLAGRPGERTVPPDAVDDAAAVGVDALAFLTRTREALA